jgi:phage terminase large subunit-like protein
MTRAEKVIAFIERYLRIPEGQHVGEKLKLAKFQTDFIYDVYDNPIGTRRAYLSMARKNAKTATIACLVLAHTAGPEARQNSQIVSGAMSRDQAALVFNLAAKMVQLSPELAKLVRIVPSGKRLIGLARNVEYRALAADGSTAHGLSPVLAILDEVGQVKGPQSDFIDAITTAQGAYEDPLLIAISTQAPTDADLFSIWLDGAAASKDPRVVSHVHTAPEGCELDDQAAWKLANPALDLFRSRSDLEEQAQRAKEMASAQNTFRVLCLNQRVNMFSPLVSKDKWMACRGDARFVDGEEVFLALDLSSVDDLTALVMVSADETDRVQPFFWKPEDSLQRQGERDNVDYRNWRKIGDLDVCPGATIDPAVVANKIAYLCKRYKVRGLAYDRWRVDSLLRELERIGLPAQKGDGDGLRLIDWGQGYASMAGAIDAFERSVLERILIHGGNQVLTWNVANAVVTQDPAGNRKLDKAKARFRIDGAVALSMALGLKARECQPAAEKTYQILFV